MNREVLFRGKRVDNGEWVYGGICDYGGGVSIFVVNHYEGSFYEPPYTDLDEVDVDPSTVGEFTGLYDKNGKRIFEGDIVRTKKYGKVVMDSCINDFDVFSVVYEPCMFRLEREDPPRCFNLVGNGADYEVIGNIHENAELKGEDLQ